MKLHELIPLLKPYDCFTRILWRNLHARGNELLLPFLMIGQEGTFYKINLFQQILTPYILKSFDIQADDWEILE